MYIPTASSLTGLRFTHLLTQSPNRPVDESPIVDIITKVDCYTFGMTYSSNGMCIKLHEIPKLSTFPPETKDHVSLNPSATAGQDEPADIFWCKVNGLPSL
ncbi:unnamed protein product [Protopolystoma xenopodis]|uniref:Uncharacterized protein n=1 Tax=Protopolystoma xenopodis TaxID=117903 RepID=A0A3S4ZKH0_9PLAT|nr:unnamed protein product [Protopolystoma xenopodis]